MIYTGGATAIGKDSSLVVAIGILGNLAGYPILDPIAADTEVQAIRQTLLETPGVSGVHDVRTRRMGDMIVVNAQKRVLQHHRVLHVLTHIDPWKRPDLDHTLKDKA